MIWLLQLFIVSLFLRSNAYIGNTAFSLMNILNVLVLFYLIFINKQKINKGFSIVLYSFFIFFLIEFLYLVFYYRCIEQVVEFYYSSFIFSTFLLVYYVVKYDYERFIKITFKTVFFIYLVMFFLVLYELITLNHLPGSKAGIEEGFKLFPTAFFHNPNDFAVVVVMFYPVIYYFFRILKCKVKFTILSILTLFFVLATMSRLALILLVIFPFFLLFIHNKIKYLFFISAFFFSLFFILIKVDFNYLSLNNELLQTNVNKIITIFKSFDDDGHLTEQGSSIITNVRFKMYQFVFDDPTSFIFGKGFIASEVFFKNNLIPIPNPHSYWVEIIFNFGLLGLVPMLFVFCWLFFVAFTKIKKHYFFRLVIVQLIYFIILVHVPSSILSLHVCWIPLAITVALLFNFKEQENKFLLS